MSVPVRGLTDLHCHLLPGLDDGARDLPDACAMAVTGQADGIAAICATPHIRHDHDVRIPALSEHRARLTAALRAQGCDVEVLAGGEVSAGALAGLSDAELAAVSLGGGEGWILLEPLPGPLDDRIERTVDALSARGLRALIAHPERHWGPDLERRLERLIASGCLVQATAAFVCEEPTRAGMVSLARRGLLHVLGSDAHSARAGRPVALSAAYAALAAVAPISAHLEWMMVTAPAAIVSGRAVAPPF